MQFIAPTTLLLTIIMSIVITRDQIVEGLPVGATAEDAVTYLQEIAEDVSFVTRESERARSIFS